ncbi:MAG: FAD-binding protein [Kiritimatiellae bacterium]|nr:FAD-binding protein [Kiritimatiellia bacterium]
MMLTSPLPDELERIAGACLAQHTTFRLGGPCPLLLRCRTPSQVRAAVTACRRDGVPFRFMGGGSNLLVSDRGVDEIVIRFDAGTEPVQLQGIDVEASAGMALDALASAAHRAGIAGFEFATGIPGTLGGAVAGNAGAFGEQIGDRIVEVRVLAPDGTEMSVRPDAMAFSYRSSNVADQGWIILSVRMRGTVGDPERLRAERDRILTFRRTHHPDWRVVPTAGSFFRNIEPTSKADRRQAAGAFLESAGAGAMRVGAARAFPGHANILTTSGPEPRAADVWRLSRWMSAAVFARHGLRLTPEVRCWGTFE